MGAQNFVTNFFLNLGFQPKLCILGKFFLTSGRFFKNLPTAKNFRGRNCLPASLPLATTSLPA